MSHRTLWVSLLFASLIVCAAGCQTETDTAFATADATAVRGALDAYFNAANSGDAARWAAVIRRSDGLELVRASGEGVGA